MTSPFSSDFATVGAAIESIYAGVPDARSCVTLQDESLFSKTGNNLLFGAQSPESVDFLLSKTVLNVEGTTTFFDLGMGIGRFAMQAFLQFPHLKVAQV